MRSRAPDRRIHRVSEGGEPSSVVEQVYGQIRDRILTGAYEPGASLNAAALADEHGTSPIPIREALRRLQAEGLVEIRPNRGAFVIQVSMSDMSDLYLARKVVEVGALRVAMRSRDDYDHELLRRCLAEMGKLYKTGSRDDAYRVHRQFHLGLVSPAKSPRLNRIIETLFDTSDRYLRMTLTLSSAPDVIVEEHRAIYREICEGTPASAAKALSDHLDKSLSRAFESPSWLTTESPGD